MPNRQTSVQALLLCCLILYGIAPALASQNKRSPVGTVQLTADAEFFGNVVVTVGANGKFAAEQRLTSLTIAVGGKTFVVPPTTLQRVGPPDLKTLEVTTCPSSDGKAPWLSVHVELQHEPDAAEVKTLIVTIRGDKFDGIQIQRAHRTTHVSWEDIPADEK